MRNCVFFVAQIGDVTADGRPMVTVLTTRGEPRHIGGALSAVQTHDGARKSIRSDRKVQLAIGHGQAERHAPLETLNQCADEGTIDGVQLQRLGPVNPFA